MRRLALLATAIAILAAACGGETGVPISGAITKDNVAFLLTADEVSDHARDDEKIESAVVDQMPKAVENEVTNLDKIEAWLELDYGQRPDGARVKLSVIDHVDPEAASARFDLVVEETGLVESDQGIGDRFAGLAPRQGIFDTFVLVQVEDKVLLFVTVITLTDPSPLVSSEQLVELSRLVAPRILP